ncbi:hypothetical protein BGZ65_003792 [Modicella reniformis]|uniref:RRM domain-containing protein n=1 Tax=Modicella reniformis TaxID=1440133 RepID=A0A9P6M963_9FUNG|nr:hypothetical protein BGZ65_003792 [Modicella reniformis]
MAARFLDMALDDVAKSRAAENRSPNPRRGGGRGGGPTGRDSPSRSNRSLPYSRNTEDRWTHDKFEEVNSGERGSGDSKRPQSIEGNAKIIVENLHYAVTLEDIKELFDTHAGPVKFAEVKYDPSGRSTGVATVLFKVPADAATAIRKLHGIALDGQSMKITYAQPAIRNRDNRPKEAPKRDVFSRLGSSEADIASRLGKLNPVPRATGGRPSQGTSSNQSRKQGPKPAQSDRKKPQVKTAEELDAEMDTYMGDGN